MVTERLAKHCCGERCKTSLFGEREGGRARPRSSGFEDWCTHTNTHTNAHTCAVELGSCCRWWKVNIGRFVGRTRVLGIIREGALANNCLQHVCYLIFAEPTDWGHCATLLLDPCHLVWQQAGTAEDLVFPAPLSHGTQGFATLHITFHLLLGPQFFRAALQGPVVWNRNVFSVLHCVPRFWLLLCGTCTCTCTVLCALAPGFTPLYPAAASQLSADLHWASVSPWLWNILSRKDHWGVPPHL